LQETDGGDITQAVYTLGLAQFGDLVSQRRDGATQFYHFDGLGSTDQLTDVNGTVTGSYLYKSFGGIMTSSGATINPFRFVGQEGYYWNSDLGTYWLRARIYDPVTGRLMSRDPLAPLLSMKLYVYADNDPANRVDSTGLAPRRKPIPATKPGKCSDQIEMSGVNLFHTLAYFCCLKGAAGWKKTKSQWAKYYGSKEPLPVTQPRWNATIIGVTDPNIRICGRPLRNQWFGVTGLGPSIGFIIWCKKKGKIEKVIPGHCSGDTLPILPLRHWDLRGCQAVICGGDNSRGSNCHLSMVIYVLSSMGIKIKGLVDGTGCFLGSDGDIYRQWTDKASQDFNDE
jgi:RHS repeat-associated protein